VTSRLWVGTPPFYYVADIRARSGGVFPGGETVRVPLLSPGLAGIFGRMWCLRHSRRGA